MSLYNKTVTPTSVFCNDLVSVDSEWSAGATGALLLAQNQTAKVALVKLDAPIGSRLLKVTVHAGAGATAGQATATTVSIRKVVATAGGVTDSEIEGVSAVSVVADTELSIDAELAGEVVRENTSYYARVTATTANNAACDVALVGATLQYQ